MTSLEEKPAAMTPEAAVLYATTLIGLVSRWERVQAEQKKQIDKARGKIKEALARAGLTTLTTPDGSTAVVYDAVSAEWSLPRLLAALTPAELDELLPRKPDGAKLRKRYDSDKEFAARVREAFTIDTQHKLRVDPPKAPAAAA